MYKQCKTEQSAQRQRELEKGLLEAMFQQDYDEISVSDLCDRLGIPRKSFYRYFSSKDGALYAMIDHVLMDYDLYTSENKLEENCTMLQYMEKIFEYWQQHREFLNALQKSRLSGLMIQRAILRAQDETSRPVRFISTGIQAEQEHATMFLVCGLMSMVVQWHSEGYRESVQEMAKIALRLLTQPLVPYGDQT